MPIVPRRSALQLQEDVTTCASKISQQQRGRTSCQTTPLRHSAQLSSSTDDSTADSASLRDCYASFFAPPTLAPLPQTCFAVETKGDSDGDDQSDEDVDEPTDEWGGFSSSDDDCDDHSNKNSTAKVEIIDYSAVDATLPPRSTRKHASFTLPESLAAGLGEEREADPQDKEDESEESAVSAAAMLKKDLELSRLLRESHILLSAPEAVGTLAGITLPESVFYGKSGRASGTAGDMAKKKKGTGPNGGQGHSSSSGEVFTQSERKARRLALDLRMQALGAKGTLVGHRGIRKMAMKERKSILAKERALEEKYRREAKENGIVLARPDGLAGNMSAPRADFGGHNRRKKHRDYGVVDLPGIGTMQGGELRLSKRDIYEMQEKPRFSSNKRKSRR